MPHYPPEIAQSTAKPGPSRQDDNAESAARIPTIVIVLNRIRRRVDSAERGDQVDLSMSLITTLVKADRSVISRTSSAETMKRKCATPLRHSARRGNHKGA